METERKYVKHHIFDPESISMEDQEQINKVLGKYKCPNIQRAHKALESCKHYKQKFVAARYGMLAVEKDFEAQKPVKKDELDVWMLDKEAAKRTFLTLISEGGWEV